MSYLDNSPSYNKKRSESPLIIRKNGNLQVLWLYKKNNWNYGFVDFAPNVICTWGKGRTESNEQNHSPYTIEEKTQMAESAVVTPDQTKLIHRIYTETLIMIQEHGPDLTMYLNKLLGTSKPKLKDSEVWIRKSWQNLESFPKTESYIQRLVWTENEREYESKTR